MLRCLKVAALTAVTVTMFQSPALAEQPATDTAAKEKKICKNEIVTGSVRTKRICYTKDQWAALEARSKDQLERRRNEDTARGMVGMNR
jgi:hypothetical protein